ncbi:MAG: hypothetical protein RIF41_34470 [Polyangiaceae bacterium]
MASTEGYRGARQGGDEIQLSCEGTIVECSAMQTSSATGMSAAVFKYSIGALYTSSSERGQSSVVELVGSVIVSGDLLLDTEHGVVAVPEGSFTFPVSGALRAASALAGPVPEACAHLVRGAPYYAEKFLSIGDVVELTATVRPSPRSDVRYEVVPEHDAVLVDRTLESMGVDVEGLKDNFGRNLQVVLFLFLLALVMGAVYIATQ